MPPDLQDVLISIDNFLRKLTQESKDPDIPVNYVPFYSEDSLNVATPLTLLVTADAEQGLGSPGRTGYVINDGTGSIYIIIDDGRVGKSKEIRIDNGEWFSVAREDEIWVDKLTLRTTVDGTNYRCLFSR